MMIAANGITLHAEEHGAGDTALLFLHYWGGSSRTWRPVIEALPAGLRAIALDARGWGRSDRPPSGYDIETMAADVEASIEALGLRRYLLVGHSMGGKVAMLLASRRPAGLAGLVLVAPSPAQGKALSEAERSAMATAYADPAAVASTIDHVLTARPLPRALREQAIEDGIAGAPAAKAAWPATMIAQDVSADLWKIEVPVLVIAAEADKVDGPDMLLATVLPTLPNAALAVIAQVGHLLPLEAPVEVARLIGDVLRHRGAAVPTTPDRPDDVPAVFDAAVNRGDLDALLALFHPDAVMRMTDGAVVEGRLALRGALGALLASRVRLRNVVRRVLASGDTALLLSDWVTRVSPPDGGEIIRHGVATQIVQRDGDGVWRLRIANPLGIQ